MFINNFTFMKFKWAISLIIASALIAPFANANNEISVYQEKEDTQIIDAILAEEAKELNVDFEMKTFNSCKAVSEVMEKYIEKQKAPYPYYKNMMFAEDDMVLESAEVSSDSTESKSTNGGVWGESYSKTNTQVKGVDEAEIVKTNWKYVYYYNEAKKGIFILEKNGNDLKVVKKINVPKKFYGVEMYITDEKLVILGSGYSEYSWDRFYYFNRWNKTYSIIYDISDVNKPSLERIDVTDWNLSNSRRIGDTLYVLSENSFSYPYYYRGEKPEISSSSFIPKQITISKTADEDKQNLKIKDKAYPYNVTSGKASECNEISYVVPDEETLDKYSFTPSYTTVSAIYLGNPEKETENKVIMWDVREVYMSLDNLYVTSHVYSERKFSCPAGAFCIMPWYPMWENTAIHKMSIDGQKVEYKNSNLVSWTPLTQYSMDEHEGNFRIITQNWWEKRATNVYVLDEDLELEGHLWNIAPGEDFKSSRFMWDKLYLVTFEQIDPLFTIDMSDSSNPKILGELKIPGYSTYLHPYDEDHLIGLGYDTKINEYGWVFNNGLKVDLYDVSDLENPTQKYTLTVWEAGSYSEALSNPRMFVWDSERKTLLIPAKIQTNEEGQRYKTKTYFNGVISFEINKDSWIKEKWRITHLETKWMTEKRNKECEKYLEKLNSEKQCRTLLNWEEYCEKRYVYVPNYCYADSSIDQYIAAKSWELKDSLIKRVIYIGDSIISLSDSKTTTHDFDNITKRSETFFEQK